MIYRLLCRWLGHSWSAVDWYWQNGENRWLKTCCRCGVEKEV